MADQIQEPSLEEIMSFIDESETDGLVDPMDNNSQIADNTSAKALADLDPLNQPTSTEEEEEEEEEDEIINESSEEDDSTQTSTETSDETQTSEEDESSADGINYESAFKTFSELGILNVDEDFEFDGSQDAFATAVEQTQANLQQKAQASLLERLGEDFQKALVFISNEGGTLRDFYKQAYVDVDLDNIDITNKNNQRRVIEEYFKQTTKHSTQRIQRHIDRYEELGLLEEEAKSSLAELIDLEARNRDLLAAQADENKRKAIQADKDYRKQIESIVDNATYVDSGRKGKLKAFMNNVSQVEEQKPSSQFVRTLTQIAQVPEHRVQLADLLLHSYDPKKGFGFDRIVKKQKTNTTSKIRESVNSIFDASGKVRGPAQAPAKSDWDWEKFLAQN